MKALIQKYCPFIPLLALCVFYTYKAVDFPIHDFSNYYFGGKCLANGNFNSNIYFPYWFNHEIVKLGHDGLFTSFAPNTPFLAVAFSPLSWIQVATAKLIFNAISVLLFVFSLYRLQSHYQIKPLYALLIPIVFLVPIKNELLFGQVYFLLFFLLAETLLAYEKEQFYKMAVYLSLAILLKVFPIFLVLIFAFRKQFKPLLSTFACCLILIGFSLLFVDWKVWMFFFRTVLPKASNGEIAGSFVDNYQSVFMFLKRLLVYDSMENPNAFFHSSTFFSAIILAFKIGLIAVGFFISRKGNNNLAVFSYWVLAAILISPYGSTYSFIVLVFVFFSLTKSEFSDVKKYSMMGLLLFVNNLPLSLFMEKQYPLSYLRLLFLLLLFEMFLIQIRGKINWKIIAGVSLAPMIAVLVFAKEATTNSKILLKNAPILIYDYAVKTNPESHNYYLVAHFWDGQEKVIIWKQEIKSATPLPLKDNQVFINNQQLTFDKSNKLKPTLIDNKTILYLSDYDRGIGFYTIRKINLR